MNVFSTQMRETGTSARGKGTVMSKMRNTRKFGFKTRQKENFVYRIKEK